MTEQTDIREQLGLGDSVYLRLTEDELALVLAAARVPRILGFEIPKDLPQAALEAARHTLRARGGAQLLPDGKLLISEEIANLVSKGARWGRAITLAFKFETDYVERHWIYLGRGDAVHHSIPEAGIHQFQTIPDGKTMLLALAALLRIRLRNETAPGDTEFSVAPQVIEAADAARAANGPDAAYQTLVAANLPELFAQSAARPAINAAVSVLWPTTGQPNAQGKIDFTERLMWLWGAPEDRGYWMLFPDRETRSMRVVPASGRSVISVISDFAVEDLQPVR
jgi:hypothetical protein